MKALAMRTSHHDRDLIAASLAGDRQAFGQIVQRYQNLICSIAYSATGSLSQSEDLAQETFITAWKGLRDLREAAKLRAWLCGIARNLVNNSLRRGRRDAASVAEPLESLTNLVSQRPVPAEEVISREEEAILWRSLERIPELYREPLILYYREQESISQVAEALELSEEAVKQRLSRGRKLLRDQVLEFVEGALKRSAPGKAFAFGVIAALPAVATSTSAATLGASAVKGSIAAKSAAGLGLLGGLLGPVLGFLGGYIGAKISIENTKSLRERKFMVSLSWAGMLLAIGYTALLTYLLLDARVLLSSNPRAWVAAFIALLFGYLLVESMLTVWANRRQRQIREEEAARQAGMESQRGGKEVEEPVAFEYRSKTKLLGWPLVHVRSGKSADLDRQLAKGWIAVGDSAFGILLAVGGTAVGGIAVGGLSLGLISIGGFAFGALALGGWAVGAWAAGGGAVGWFAAYGGLAIAQHYATGGLAVAQDYATGGMAIGHHANDDLAKTLIAGNRFIALNRLLTENSRWLFPPAILVLLFGSIFALFFGWRQLRKLQKEKSKAHRVMLLLAFIAGPGVERLGQAAEYVVADAVGNNDPFYRAVEKLAAHRRGQIVPLEVNNLTAFRDALRQQQPRFVAVVLRPECLDYDFARRFLVMATQIDDDPFVDFSYGFITGATAEEAAAFVERSINAEQTKREPELGNISVWEIAKSQLVRSVFPLRNRTIPQLEGRLASPGDLKNSGRDTQFIKEFLPKLSGKSLVIFGGHGYPREVVGGPTWRDLAGLKLDSAVALNIACYTGVNETWFENDWKTRTVRKRKVPMTESFALALLRTGVIGYVAYLCPRPAGPELFTDVSALAGEGMSLGDVRRRDYDKIVLGYLGYGAQALELKPVTEGQKLEPPKDVVRDQMLEMGTGGILFGDPALTPFPSSSNEAPVAVKIAQNEAAKTLTVDAEVAVRQLFYCCSEPTASWDGSGAEAMKVYAKVPLSTTGVREVSIRQLSIGNIPLKSRLVWAVESDRGEHFIHLKAIFARPKVFPGAVQARFRVQLTDDPAAAVFQHADAPATERAE